MKKGLRITGIVILIAAGIALAVFGGMMVRGMIRIISSDGSEALPADPMFAEPALSVTRPPEFDAEETQKPHKTLDDYLPDVETPVEKTARELMDEARQSEAG